MKLHEKKLSEVGLEEIEENGVVTKYYVPNKELIYRKHLKEWALAVVKMMKQECSKALEEGNTNIMYATNAIENFLIEKFELDGSDLK